MSVGVNPAAPLRTEWKSLGCGDFIVPLISRAQELVPRDGALVAPKAPPPGPGSCRLLGLRAGQVGPSKLPLMRSEARARRALSG